MIRGPVIIRNALRSPRRSGRDSRRVPNVPSAPDRIMQSQRTAIWSDPFRDAGDAGPQRWMAERAARGRPATLTFASSLRDGRFLAVLGVTQLGPRRRVARMVRRWRALSASASWSRRWSAMARSTMRSRRRTPTTRRREAMVGDPAYYMRRFGFRPWNHVRTVSCTVSLVLLIAAIAAR